MFIRKTIIRFACSAFLLSAVFLSLACQEPRPSAANQAKSFVAKKTAVNKSSDSNVTISTANADVSDDNANRQSDAEEKTVADTKFAAAAAQNSQLKFYLTWTFGGKAQRGWFIYAKLINRLIDTDDASVDSSEFAEALARWQAKNGLAPNGILNETTLVAIIKNWQSNRLKGGGYAAPNELLTAPPADFYIPERPEELRQLERKTYAAYKKMVAAAIADKSPGLETDGKGNLAASEKFLKIISAFRSREYQEKLRRESPNSGRAGLATNSPHFTGRALDIYVGGEPVDTKDANRAFQVQTRAYRWLVKNAGRFGFKPYFYEPWHWEFVGSE